MKLENKTIFWQIDTAIEFFNSRISAIITQIDSLPTKKYFTYCDLNNHEVAHTLLTFLNSDRVVQIKAYKSLPFSRVIGYTKNGEYFINSRKIKSLTISDWAGNIAHEISHLASFKHKGNRVTSSNKMSVPYSFGDLVSGKILIQEVEKRVEL